MELFQRYTEKRPKSKSRIKLHYNPSFKPQYPHTSSPNQSPYISFKN